MRRGIFLRAVEFLRQPLVEGVVDQGALAAAGDAGYTDQLSQWKFDVDMLEIVAYSPTHPEALVAAATTFGRHRHAATPTQIVAGDRLGVLGDLRWGPCGGHLAAKDPGAGSHIQHVIRGTDGIFVMFDDDD